MRGILPLPTVEGQEKLWHGQSNFIAILHSNLNFSDNVKVEVLALAEILREEGPELNRPHADTLKGSRHSNMKELRCRGACKTWRVAFAFTPTRVALLLAAGDKSGTKEKRFYKSLIKKADARFDQFLTETTNSETAANERK